MKKRLKDDIILLDKMIEDEYKENKKKFKRNKKSLSYEEAKLNDFLEKKSVNYYFLIFISFFMCLFQLAD